MAMFNDNEWHMDDLECYAIQSEHAKLSMSPNNNVQFVLSITLQII